MTEPTPFRDNDINNVGEGWHPIIRNLEGALALTGCEYEVVQIKEKFGTLRYYVARGSEPSEAAVWAFEALISHAEWLSQYTCEVCGNRAETKTIFHWRKTLCEEHTAERYAERLEQRREMQAVRAEQ
jgi:hypothetical protein